MTTATKAQAQADIAEDGYWGVEQTSDRILDFAKALSGNDPEKADLLLDAFKKGFEQATGAWGKELPDISQRTYDAVVEKFEAWKNGDAVADCCPDRSINVLSFVEVSTDCTQCSPEQDIVHGLLCYSYKGI